jgi:hypothetical protein
VIGAGEELDHVNTVMENEEGTREKSPALVPPHVNREDPRDMRDWYLRRAQRALGFARQMLCEATEDAAKGAARERVRYSIERAGLNSDRAFARLHKDLRRLQSLRVYQWVSWLDRGEVPKSLHGEARTLAEAKEGALRDLQAVEGLKFHSEYSDQGGVALVTGPLGARYELRRTYSRKGKYRGFRWHSRGREVTWRGAIATPYAVAAAMSDDPDLLTRGNERES